MQASNQSSMQASKEASKEASMQARKQACNQSSKHASKQARRQAIKQANKQSIKHAINQSINQARKQASMQASKQASNQSSKKACKQASRSINQSINIIQESKLLIGLLIAELTLLTFPGETDLVEVEVSCGFTSVRDVAVYTKALLTKPKCTCWCEIQVSLQATQVGLQRPLFYRDNALNISGQGYRLNQGDQFKIKSITTISNFSCILTRNMIITQHEELGFS